MTKISGFSFIHNGIEGGYPFVEAIKAIQDYVDEIVIVDMQSTDDTREILEKLGVRILDGYWGDEAGKTLREAHSQYINCDGDIIWHFEADEVYELKLVNCIKAILDEDRYRSLSVWRLQVEQNFQRIRWYPEPVHRIFEKWAHVRKEGHTTNQAGHSLIIGSNNGFLWDCTNCFRNNWIKRINNQAELWAKDPQYIQVPLHTMHNSELNQEQAILRLGEDHWTWTETPLAIPKILRPLVGQTEYKPKLD